jgi:hypothetical protein
MTSSFVRRGVLASKVATSAPVGPQLQHFYEVDTGAVQNTTTLTTPSFTVAVGDVIVIAGSANIYNQPYGFPTISNGDTITFGQSIANSSQTVVGIFWLTVQHAGTVTISADAEGDTTNRTLAIWHFNNAKLAGSPAGIDAASGSGTPSASLTTTAKNSVVVWMSSDKSAKTGARAYSSNCNEDAAQQNTYQGAYYVHTNVIPTAVSTTVSMSTPASQNWAMLGVEVLSA